MFEFQLLFFYKKLSTIDKAKVDHLQKELKYLFQNEVDNTVAQSHLYRKNIVFSLPFPSTRRIFHHYLCIFLMEDTLSVVTFMIL